MIMMIFTTEEQETENLFGEVYEEDYYKSIKVKGAFNDNYIEN